MTDNTTPYPALPKPALSVSGFKDLFHEDQMRDYVQSDRAARAGDAEPFQQRVQPWLLQCFGAVIAADLDERNHRFLEESLELVQSCGCTASEAHQLVDYVFGRPVGEPAQEAGGVMVTLAALCLAKRLDMHEAGEVELARIWTMVEAIRAKQAAKPKHSPLPAAPQAPERAGDAEPIDMVLHCPKCGFQHIDAVEPAVMPDGMFEGDDGWDNPPHRSHLCRGCGHIWRPADVPTNGVAAVKTKGKGDSPISAAQAPAPVAAEPAKDGIPIDAAIGWQEMGTGVERKAVMVSGRTWYRDDHPVLAAPQAPAPITPAAAVESARPLLKGWQGGTKPGQPLIARALGEWHEDDGCVVWWAWNGNGWAGEPAWIGSPLCDDWPGYHTHWTPHPMQPALAASREGGAK